MKTVLASFVGSFFGSYIALMYLITHLKEILQMNTDHLQGHKGVTGLTGSDGTVPPRIKLPPCNVIYGAMSKIDPYRKQRFLMKSDLYMKWMEQGFPENGVH